MIGSLGRCIFEEGIQIGREMALAEIQAEREAHNLTTIQTISSSLGVSYEKAMDILKISDQGERQRYLDQLTH